MKLIPDAWSKHFHHKDKLQGKEMPVQDKGTTLQNKGTTMKLQRKDFLIRNANQNYDVDFIEKRLLDLEDKIGKKVEKIRHYTLKPKNLTGNIENFIGATQVPLGIAGPLLINGDHANGVFYVPMATTEGSLVDSFTRAMMVSAMSGGVKTKIIKDVMHITPLFYCKSVEQAIDLSKWLEKNFQKIKQKAEETTSHGKLKSIETMVFTTFLYVRFIFDTGDAMGLNMINISTNNACHFISENFDNIKYILRSNLSSDKKASFINNINGYGKTVYAECTLSPSVLRRYLKTDAKTMIKGWKIANYSQMIGGTVGLNQHFANGLAAVFIATGQDVAQIVNGSTGWSILEELEDGSLFGSITIPNLLIGTVGGGTHIGTQREALEIMDCYGEGKSNKMAEIIAATVSAGELSLGAAMVHGDFILAHAKKNRDVKRDLEKGL
jgi:hydroxymethylglutaryl-CoA reductase (NADPH)